MTKLIDKRERAYQAFEGFLTDFIRDLNHLAEDRWGVLVEGHRDKLAVRSLGYKGPLVTVSDLGRKGPPAFGPVRRVIILTDLDREGGVLASRCAKKLAHDGFDTSFAERRRLRSASRGVFLHIENLSRFSR